MNKISVKELKAQAKKNFPYPVNGSWKDPDDFKLRCKKVDDKRKAWVNSQRIIPKTKGGL